MASIRLQFPGGQEAREIALRGARITVGRSPDNTIQIIDRTLSAHHAEFVEHGDHYHLRDTASTNGVFVNGEPVTDFHLRESCRIAFGTFECEFNAEGTGADANLESLPSAAEVRALREENAGLQARLGALQEEVSALLAARGESGGEAAAGEDLGKLAAERAALRAAQESSAQEIARLQGELAVAQRDRDHLQRAWDAAKADLDAIRQELTAAAEPPPTPSPEAPRSTIPAPRPVPAATPRAIPGPGARPVPGAVPAATPRSVPGATPRAVPTPGAASRPAGAPTSPGQPRAVPRTTPAPPRAGDTQKL
jgi:hypothetical protein